MKRPYSWPQLLLYSLRAAALLGLARWRLHRTTPDDVLALNAQARAATANAANTASRLQAHAACDAVEFFIPRLAFRVPWRADCLVQAMAGQRWLKAKCIASDIAIGTAKLPSGDFESHAWLVCSGRIVLGGDISRFTPLMTATGT